MRLTASKFKGQKLSLKRKANARKGLIHKAYLGREDIMVLWTERNKIQKERQRREEEGKNNLLESLPCTNC